MNAVVPIVLVLMLIPIMIAARLTGSENVARLAEPSRKT